MTLATLDSFPDYARALLRIKGREGGRLEPLILNRVQLRLYQAIQAQLSQGTPAKIAVLKSRRLGVSTFVAGLFSHRTFTRPYQRGLVVAHKGAEAKKLFGIYERMYENLPATYGGIPVKPKRTGGRGQSLLFHGMDSSLEVSQAGSSEAGRGGEAQMIHLSECGFYPDPEGFLQAMLPSFHKVGDGLLILESTAGVFGDAADWWESTWKDARDGQNGYEAHFYGWYEEPSFRMPFAVDADDYSDEEKALVARFGVDGYQIAWLREVEETDCFGNPDRRRKEYPATPEEAFTAIGDRVWSQEALEGCYERMEPVARYVPAERGMIPSKSREAEGVLIVWEEPQEGAQYVIGGDPASGIGKDPSACEVWKVSERPGVWPEQVAELVTHEDPVSWGHTLARVGLYYNQGLLVCEVNGVGYGTQATLQKLGYPWLHRWVRWDHTRHTGDTWGWECPSESAMILMSDLTWERAKDVRQGDEIVGFRESLNGGRGVSHPFSMQKVTAKREFIAPIIEVELENGQRTRVSENHPFWAACAIGSHPKRGWQWVLARNLTHNHRVKHIEPWKVLTTYEAGRLSAFLDGEGHLSHNELAGFDLLTTQAEGELADEIHDLWIDLGFRSTTKWLRHKKRPHKTCVVSGVRNFQEVLRALGSLRPTRLLRKFAKFDIGCATLKSLPSVQVKSVRHDGEGLVIGLTTEPDHTLIADGIIGHNTTWKSKQILMALADWLIRTGHVTFHSPWLMEELLAFQLIDTGGVQEQYEGVRGDDRIMATMIAWASWYQHINPGTPLEDLRKTLAGLYGSKSAGAPHSEDEDRDWVDKMYGKHRRREASGGDW